MSCLPNTDQLLLLQACLGEDRRALHAWRQWQDRVDFQTMDAGSFRLIPLLYSNLVRLGATDPVLSKYKGILRYAWIQNHKTFRLGLRMLGELQAMGCRTMVLKGAVLARSYYAQVGLRPMIDFDIMIDVTSYPRVRSHLLATGWVPIFDIDANFMIYRNSANFQKQGEGEIDIHWYLLMESCDSVKDRVFWEAAVPYEWDSLRTFRLCPTHFLFHVIVHGARWNEIPPITWIADAVHILRRDSEQMDWKHFYHLARQLEVGTAVANSMKLLVRHFDVNVVPPPADLDGSWDRKYYAIAVFPPTPARHLRRQWLHFKKVRKSQSRSSGFLFFGWYLIRHASIFWTRRRWLRHGIAYLQRRFKPAEVS